MVQGSGESLRQLSDWVLTLATRSFPYLPDVHAQAIPRLCYGAEDKDAGMFTLGGQSKTVKEAVNRMQIFQQIQDLKRRIKRLVRALQERPLVQPNLPRSTSSPRAAESPLLLQMPRSRSYRRNCPRNSGAKADGITGG